MKKMDKYDFTSVENIPGLNAKAAFISDSSKVFKDDVNITPIRLDDNTKYVPWGADNMMPFYILDLIERDETLATCQIFNAEVCYASGLKYNTEKCNARVQKESTTSASHHRCRRTSSVYARTSNTSDGVSPSSSWTTMENE